MSILLWYLFLLSLFRAELKRNDGLCNQIMVSWSNYGCSTRWVGKLIQAMRNSSFIDYEWRLINFAKVNFASSKSNDKKLNYIGPFVEFPAKILPQNCMDLVKSDPGLIQSKPEPSVYRCRKCRRIVAAKSNLITHAPKTAAESTAKVDSKHVTFKAEIHAQHESSSDELHIEASAKVTASGSKRLVDRVNTLCISSTSEKSSADEDASSQRCQEILFVEPLAWMLDICKQTQGKLNCPKCHSKLGNFTWINSCNCPCGKNISPAFYLVPSKVELTHSVQNVEITVWSAEEGTKNQMN